MEHPSIGSEITPATLYAEHKLAAAALERLQAEAANNTTAIANSVEADEEMDRLARQQEDPEMAEWIRDDKAMAGAERAQLFDEVPTIKSEIAAAENRVKANLFDSMQHLAAHPDQYDDTSVESKTS